MQRPSASSPPADLRIPILIHPDDRARVITVDVKSRMPGDRLEDEYRITRAGGRVIWIREEGQVTTSSDPDTIWRTVS